MNKETVRKQLKLNTMKHCDEHGDWKKRIPTSESECFAKQRMNESEVGFAVK